MTTVRELCSGCALFNTVNGQCKLYWVTSEDQKNRAKDGYCGDAVVQGGDGKVYSAPAVIVPEKIIKKGN